MKIFLFSPESAQETEKLEIIAIWVWLDFKLDFRLKVENKFPPEETGF